jgi:NodT family efflux transporter outer membrane factor (OMF) lipoprotein
MSWHAMKRDLDLARNGMGNGKRTGRALSVVLLSAILAGCAAGPDFQRPPAPDVLTYTASPLPARSASAKTALGESQHFGGDAALPAEWWKVFRSAKLNDLVAEGLRASATLASAQAALRQAQETSAAQAGSTVYPQVDAGMGAQRQRMNPSALGQPGEPRVFNVYDAGIGVRYQLDLAGGNRRALEALAARAEYRRYELEGARLTLVGSIVRSAVTQAMLAGQIEATQRILAAREEQLRVTQQRVRLGHVQPNDALALQTEVEQTRAEIPRLRKQLQQSEHLLAVLVARTPGAGGLPTLALEDFTLPQNLPHILPSELVRRRPDIQAAESLLHAANAEYGVAVAKLYPRVDLSTSIGSQALSTGALFGGGATVWSLIGQLTQPLFNPGLPAEKRASLAALDAAAANYQGVVLESLRNVADILRALENDAETLAALAAADAAAQESERVVGRQYQLGAANYLQLLAAQEQAQQVRIALISAQAQRLLDSGALYQALGGGGTGGDGVLVSARGRE